MACTVVVSASTVSDGNIQVAISTKCYHAGIVVWLWVIHSQQDTLRSCICNIGISRYLKLRYIVCMTPARRTPRSQRTTIKNKQPPVACILGMECQAQQTAFVPLGKLQWN